MSSEWPTEEELDVVLNDAASPEAEPIMKAVIGCALNEAASIYEYHTFVRNLNGLPESAGLHEALLFAAVGLTEEAGEVLGIMKKVCWHGRDLDRDKLIEEAGDTLWYLTFLCNELNISLHDLIATNTAKLKKRYPDGYSHEASAARVDEVK